MSSASGADLSAAVAAAVETAGRAVVRVEGRRRGPSSGIAWSADGVIVAAHHNVEWDEDIAVGLWDATTRTFTELEDDPLTKRDERRAANAVRIHARRIKERDNPIHQACPGSRSHAGTAESGPRSRWACARCGTKRT